MNEIHVLNVKRILWESLENFCITRNRITRTGYVKIRAVQVVRITVRPVRVLK